MNTTILFHTLAIIAGFVLFMAGITMWLYRRIAIWGSKKAAAAASAEKMQSAYANDLFGRDEMADLLRDFHRMETVLGVQMKNIASMSAEREKARTEMNVATRIQKDMIPCNFSSIKDAGMCDIYGSMTPAKEVGGDFYDFFALDDDRLCLVIADVSGKGVPGALFMTISKVMLRQRALSGGTPAEILADVNDQLCADNREMLFVTVWLGIVNTKTGDVDYGNAGHEYPVILHREGASLLSEDSNDPPLALVKELPYTDKKIRLQPGEGLFVYTDGLPEAKNKIGRRYGLKRMQDKLNSFNADAACQTVIETINENLNAFTDGSEPFDDVTMLMIRLGDD